MRTLTIEYNFFRGGAVTKLIVRAGSNVRISAVVGCRVYHAVYYENIEVSSEYIRVGEDIFKTDSIQCELKLQGLSVSCNAEIRAVTAFKRPLGLLCEMGLSCYTVGSPAVSAAVVGRVRFGNLSFESCTLAVIGMARGTIQDYRHTVISGAGTQGSFFLTFGENESFHKTWEYALACVVTPLHVYTFTGAAKLAKMTETSDTVHAVFKSPTSKLELSLVVDNECEDECYRYSVTAVSTLTMTVSNHKTETLRIPSSFAHRGTTKVRCDEKKNSKELGKQESKTVRNDKLN